MSGVDSRLNSGRGPRLSVLNRQATSRLPKLLRWIWSSGEYRVRPRSAPYVRHSPFFAPDWPITCIVAQCIKNARAPSAAAKRHRFRFMFVPFVSLSNSYEEFEADLGAGEAGCSSWI